MPSVGFRVKLDAMSVSQSEGGIIERKTAAEQVAGVLRQRILDGVYGSGASLRQEALARDLGVSRIPIREALKLLETQGFVTQIKYKGAVVSNLSTREVREIYLLRAELEPFLLRHAVPHLSDRDLAAAERVIDQARPVTDLDSWAELNWQFHRTLYLKADLPMTLQLLEHVLARADRYLRVQRSLSESARTASEEQHRDILVHLRRGAHEQAVQALRDHILWNAQDLTATIEGLASASPDRVAIGSDG